METLTLIGWKIMTVNEGTCFIYWRHTGWFNGLIFRHSIYHLLDYGITRRASDFASIFSAADKITDHMALHVSLAC